MHIVIGFLVFLLDALVILFERLIEIFDGQSLVQLLANMEELLIEFGLAAVLSDRLHVQFHDHLHCLLDLLH